MLGDRKHYPLPGRLYGHGAQFDFMISFVSTEPTGEEIIRHGGVGLPDTALQMSHSPLPSLGELTESAERGDGDRTDGDAQDAVLRRSCLKASASQRS